MSTPSIRPHILRGRGVVIEPTAVDQLNRVSSHPDCVAAAGMPDLHPGPGTPIGATVAFRSTLWPALLGGDLGCGVRVMGFARSKAKGDDLVRRMDAALRLNPWEDVDLDVLMKAVWEMGPAGLASVPGVPTSLVALNDQDPHPIDVDPPDADFARQLGSVGGGNHFVELARVASVSDDETAKQVGLKKGGFAVVVHSGSRALGKEVAGRWANRQLHEDDSAEWLGQVGGAVNFAVTNRLVLAWKMLKAVGMARPSKILGRLDLNHNVVEKGVVDGESAWIHRKGAAPAGLGQPTVVLGSRGTPSFVMRGTGNAQCLCSVAHGAGRLMDRGRAKAFVKSRHKRASLTHTALGGRVMCDDKDALYTEHPDCYKPIEPVVQALEAAGAASRVAELHPVLTVKR